MILLDIIMNRYHPAFSDAVDPGDSPTHSYDLERKAELTCLNLNFTCDIVPFGRAGGRRDFRPGGLETKFDRFGKLNVREERRQCWREDRNIRRLWILHCRVPPVARCQLRTCKEIGSRSQRCCHIYSRCHNSWHFSKNQPPRKILFQCWTFFRNRGFRNTTKLPTGCIS